MTVTMVHTRNRPETPGGQVEIESTADRPGVAQENAQRPPIPNLLGGGPEKIPRFNFGRSKSGIDGSDSGGPNDGEHDADDECGYGTTTRALHETLR